MFAYHKLAHDSPYIMDRKVRLPSGKMDFLANEAGDLRDDARFCLTERDLFAAHFGDTTGIKGTIDLDMAAILIVMREELAHVAVWKFCQNVVWTKSTYQVKRLSG